MPIPYVVAIERLAQRYGVLPHQVEAMPAEWLHRCLEITRMEASVKVKRG